MPKICPKCGRPYISKGFFGTPDHTGVIGMVSHGTKKVRDITGHVHTQNTDHCFLTQEEWNKLEDD